MDAFTPTMIFDSVDGPCETEHSRSDVARIACAAVCVAPARGASPA